MIMIDLFIMIIIILFFLYMTDYDNNCSSSVICMYACQITRMLCD